MTEKKNNISTDPLENDGAKSKRGRKPKEPSAQDKYNSVHPLNDWIINLIENSDESLSKTIVNYHDLTVNTLLSLTGKYLTSHSSEYEKVFLHQISTGNFAIKDGSMVRVQPVTPEPEPKAEQKKEEAVEGDKVVFHTKNPLDNMSFKLEERQYRRIRKKINFVDNKIILETILAIEESTSKDTHVNMYVRKSVASDPEKDKVIYLTNLIHHVVTTLNEYAQPTTHESRSYWVDKFYVGLVEDITKNADGSLYDKVKLIKYLSVVRDEVKKEIDNLYDKVYRKVGLNVAKPLTAKKKPTLNLRSEPDEINTLYRNRDLDLMNLINKLDYYEMINIID